MNFPNKRILVYDIETNSTDVAIAELRYFGAYSYQNNRRYYLKGEEDLAFIEEMFENHDVIVGFNIKKFDNAVMQKYGINFTGKILIDLWEVLSEAKLDLKTRQRTGGKGRGIYMGLKLNSWKLSNIVKALELGEYKQEFNYNILKKQPEEWNEDEHKLIVEYLAQDITITKRLFEYTNNFFHPFTEFLDEKNIRRMTYITASIASLSYKIICNLAGLPETYSDGVGKPYKGGFVFEPVKTEHVGDVICLDFNSLYPGIFRTFNLASPAPPGYKGKVFKGNSLFPDVQGTYIADIQGKVEGALGILYAKRKQFKAAGDKREYNVKIIINGYYGTTANPVFEQVFTEHGAEDCTYIGRTMINYAAKFFSERGFQLLYGDTDSLYLALNGHTNTEAMEAAKELTDYFKQFMPFPNDDFKFGLDAEISGIWFFPYDDGSHRKKNYMYIKKVVNKDTGEVKEKLIVKGLPIIKSNASKIAKTIFKKHLEKKIIERKTIKFGEEWLKQMIYHEIENDLALATQTYKVRDPEYYAKNPNGLTAQIAQSYWHTFENGEGSIDLIPNNRFGVGKGKKYCTRVEFNEKKLKVQNIDLGTTMSNLEPFIKNPQQTLI